MTGGGKNKNKKKINHFYFYFVLQKVRVGSPVKHFIKNKRPYLEQIICLFNNFFQINDISVQNYTLLSNDRTKN